MGPLVWRSTLVFLLLAAPANRGAPIAKSTPSSAPKFEPKFVPTWDSLAQYRVPDWFRDAKFGIWAHWGPQCQPEQGDWYARKMYQEGSDANRWHVQHHGHPSRFGFKDVIHEWKADRWDPAKLLALYKRAGAQYFFALANHHDNFDLWDSRFQPWNAVNLGPKKDLIAGWAQAARASGLRFGVSFHAAHAWTWYEPSQGADKGGPLAGVPYDGRLTKADGKGQWWEGYDPQDLYAQDHPASARAGDPGAILGQWAWGEGASAPSAAYADKLYNRAVDLIDRYRPDLIYFDDTALPLWPVSDVGLRIAAHYYNASMAWNGGRLDAVLFGKILDEQQRRCMVWDIERGQSDHVEPQPWQTDTCLGDWHYRRSIFEQHGYKSAATVVRTLADVVSKNGNLLLNVPVRGDGTIDADEVAIVEGIARWMAVNGESIFGTRPWKIAGEGPALEAAAPLRAEGFNEAKGKPFTARDVRFTTKGGALYAIILGVPTEELSIRALGDGGRAARPAHRHGHLARQRRGAALVARRGGAGDLASATPAQRARRRVQDHLRLIVRPAVARRLTRAAGAPTGSGTCRAASPPRCARRRRAPGPAPRPSAT